MPSSGLLKCQACRDLFATQDYAHGFERWGQGEPVRLINNPTSWGAATPRYTLLGISKGETQNKALAAVLLGRASIEAVPFKGMRKRLGWLLKALNIRLDERKIDEIFSNRETEIQSSSMIKCSISAKNANGDYSYKLKDILAADGQSNGKIQQILSRCTKAHLSPLAKGQTFIILGLDDEFIQWCRNSFAAIFGSFTRFTETTYRTKDVSWVHVAHPSGTQTDPQYLKWCEGKTLVPKVLWAREEVDYRSKMNDGQNTLSPAPVTTL